MLAELLGRSRRGGKEGGDAGAEHAGSCSASRGDALSPGELLVAYPRCLWLLPPVTSTQPRNLLPYPCGEATLASQRRHWLCSQGCLPRINSRPMLHTRPPPWGQQPARGISRAKEGSGSWCPERWARALSAPTSVSPQAACCPRWLPGPNHQGQGADAAQELWGTVCTSAAWCGPAKPLPGGAGCCLPTRSPHAPGGQRMDPSHPGGGTVSCGPAPGTGRVRAHSTVCLRPRAGTRC